MMGIVVLGNNKDSRESAVAYMFVLLNPYNTWLLAIPVGKFQRIVLSKVHLLVNI